MKKQKTRRDPRSATTPPAVELPVDRPQGDGVKLTQLSYAHLVEMIAENRKWPPRGSSVRNLQSLARSWCRYFNETLESPALPTLGREDFESLLTKVTDELAQTRGRDNGADNVRGAVRDLQRTFEKVRRNSELPLDFHEAFCLVLKRHNLTAHSLGLQLEASFSYTKYVRSTLMRYASGSIHPQKKKAQPLIAHIEQVLELDAGSLASRAFKQVQPILLGNGLPISYRENLAIQTGRPYRLKQLPPSISGVWEQIVAWRTENTVTVGEAVFTRKPGEYWAKPATVRKAEAGLLYFYGFLCLPKPDTTKAHALLSRDERATTGKGMAVAELEMANVFDTKLLLEYFNFLRARNAGNKYTVHAINTLGVLCSWVNSPSSFFNSHPEFSGLFVSLNPEGKAWAELLHDIHQKLLRLKRQLSRAIDGASRNPGEPLKQVFEDKDPYSQFLELAKRMKADLPPRVQKVSRSTAFRNLVIVSMELEVPLRARNVVELEVGKTIFRDKTSGLWTVVIPKSDLKNHHSRHAEDIHRVYSPETSQLLDKYWNEERKNLRDPLKSNVLFLPGTRCQGRRKHELERHGMSSANLYMLIYSTISRYFGVGIGSNVFRHLVATGILKHDSSRYGTAAAVLNNSEEMVRRNYSHILQKDELRTASNWRQEQVDKFNAVGGQPGSRKK